LRARTPGKVFEGETRHHGERTELLVRCLRAKTPGKVFESDILRHGEGHSVW